jgi:hypothetical protein
MQYYEAPEIWLESDLKKKKDLILNSSSNSANPVPEIQQDYRTH